MQIKIESDSASSPPAPPPRARALPPKKEQHAGSDDDEIIVKPKVKAALKAETAGDDSDDALLSIIHGSKSIESDDDAKLRASRPAAKTKSAPSSSIPVDDDDEAKLHPALQPLPEDQSKRAAKSSLPLTAAPAQKQQYVLVQCDEDCADLAGDSGVIGRFKFSDGRMLLDLKGYMYEGSLVPCCSLAVVHMKPMEARVEAILDDFMALKQIGNVYDKEVAHGNIGSDDDGSDGIVLSDDEELDANGDNVPKKKKNSKSTKAPFAAAARPKTSSSSKSSSSKSQKSKPSKSKPKKSNAKPAGKTARHKTDTAKSALLVRCNQPPRPRVCDGRRLLLLFVYVHLSCRKPKIFLNPRKRKHRNPAAAAAAAAAAATATPTTWTNRTFFCPQFGQDGKL